MNIKLKCKYDYLYWFLGFNAAFALFREAFGILNILYALCLALLCMRTVIKIIRGRTSAFPFFFKFLALIMAIIASPFISDNVFGFTVSAVSSMLMIYFVRLGKPLIGEYEAFISGYKASILIDFIYAGVQAIFMLRGVNINNYLYVILNTTNHVQSSFFNRVTGLIWDPYVIGMFCATGFFLFKNKCLRAYILLILVLSQSRAGLLGFAFAAFYYYYPQIRKRKYFLQIIAVAIAAVLILLEFVDLTRGFNRLSFGWLRIEYFTLQPAIIIQEKNPILLFFGGSPVSSLVRFSKAGLSIIMPQFESLEMMECDWAGIFFGQGLFGLVAYFSVFLYVIKHQKNRTLKAISFAILFGGIGYDFDRAIFANMLVYLPLSILTNNVSETFDKVDLISVCGNECVNVIRQHGVNHSDDK